MPSFAHIAQALRATLNMMRLRDSALLDYERSAQAFYWSFFALLLAAPVQYIGSEIQAQMLGDNAISPSTGLLAVQIVAYIADWIIYPLFMIPITKQLGLSGRYATYIITYNWSKAVIYFITVPLYSIAIAGGNDQLFSTIAIPVTLWFLFYRVWLAKTALGTSWPIAIGLFIVEMVISLFLSIVLVQLALPEGTVTISPAG